MKDGIFIIIGSAVAVLAVAAICVSAIRSRMSAAKKVASSVPLGEKNYFQGVYLDDRLSTEKSLKLLTEKLGAPFPDFVMPKEDMQFFKENFKEETGIQRLILKIFGHIYMPITEYTVVVTLQGKNTREDTFVVDEDGTAARAVPNDGSTGNYGRTAKGRARIQIDINEHYTPETVFAITCHECMHHYLGNRHISLPDKNENEVLTDVATIFFGFGGYMAEGYRPIEYYPEPDQRRTMTVGYVDFITIMELKEKTERIRGNYSRIGAEQKRLNQYKEDIEKQIDIFQSVYDRYTDCLAAVLDEKDVQFEPEDLSAFQSYLFNREQDGMEARQLTEAMGAIMSERDAEEMKDAIDRLCTEYTRRTMLLSKYLV